MSPNQRKQRAKAATARGSDISAEARKRIQKAIALLGQVVDLLGDGDDLERALAGVTGGMVDSPGFAKQGTFRTFEAKCELERALQAAAK